MRSVFPIGIACSLASAAGVAWAQPARDAVPVDEPPATAEQNPQQSELPASPQAPPDAGATEPAPVPPEAPGDTGVSAPPSAAEAAPDHAKGNEASTAPPEPRPEETTPFVEVQPVAIDEEADGSDDRAEPEVETDGYDGPFSRGSIGLSILLGSASLEDREYLVLGAGASYFVLDGLSLGLDGDVWLLERPRVGTLTPQAQYVFYFVPVVNPYVGAFYRHYFIGDDFSDLNSVGARGGVYLLMGDRGYLGVGAIYEQFLDCDESFRRCGDWYPELTFGFSF